MAMKTWQQKLHIDHQPKVEVADKSFAGVQEGQRMLVPTPLIVDEYIRQIPKGKKVDPVQMKKDLAAEYHAEVTCPLTSGIFLRIAAEAAYEAYEKGAKLSSITPFWRIIDKKSTTAKKLSFGAEFLLEQQEKEGIS